MDATIKELWLIVECPHCHRPQTVNKHIDKVGNVLNLQEHRARNCTICDGPYMLRLMEAEIDYGPEFDVAGIVP